jgi:hypothetical protein
VADVIDFEAAREKREAAKSSWVAAWCFCWLCGYRCVSVMTEQTTSLPWLECPDCRQFSLFIEEVV